MLFVIFNFAFCLFFFFFFNDTATTEIYTLSLHDALPICGRGPPCVSGMCVSHLGSNGRSEEHTSELQSRFDLVCRLLLEKKKKINKNILKYHKKMNKIQNAYRHDIK